MTFRRGYTIKRINELAFAEYLRSGLMVTNWLYSPSRFEWIEKEKDRINNLPGHQVKIEKKGVNLCLKVETMK